MLHQNPRADYHRPYCLVGFQPFGRQVVRHLAELARLQPLFDGGLVILADAHRDVDQVERVADVNHGAGGEVGLQFGPGDAGGFAYQFVVQGGVVLCFHDDQSSVSGWRRSIKGSHFSTQSLKTGKISSCAAYAWGWCILQIVSNVTTVL